MERPPAEQARKKVRYVFDCVLIIRKSQPGMSRGHPNQYLGQSSAPEVSEESDPGDDDDNNPPTSDCESNSSHSVASEGSESDWGSANKHHKRQHIENTIMPDDILRQLLFPNTPSLQSGLSALANRLSDLHYAPKTGVYSFDNATCKHKTPSLSKRRSDCPVVVALLLSWSTELQMFVDTTLQTIVRPQTLLSLLAQATERTQHNPSVLLSHLLDAYPLNMDETISELSERMDSLVLNGPIDHLDDPVLHRLCEICRRWVRGTQFSSHRNRHHSGAPPGGPPSFQLFIFPLRPQGGGDLHYQRSIKVKVSSNRRTPQKQLETNTVQSHQHPIRSLLQPVPVYPHMLGWQSYLASHGDDLESVLLLLSLAKRKSPWQPNADPALDALERFLGFLSKVVQEYLHQADQRLESSHDSVRELVTYGGKGKFRSIRPQSREEYSAFPHRVISLALRWVMGSHVKDTTVEQLKRRGWKLLWKGNQLGECEKFAKKLVPIFSKGKKMSESAWHTFKGETLALIHHFFVTLFTEEFPDASPVGSIMEQALILSSFSTSSGWSPSQQVINRTLKCIQYLSRSVLVHSAYLGGFSSAWQGFTASGAADTNCPADLNQPLLIDSPDFLSQNGNAGETRVRGDEVSELHENGGYTSDTDDDTDEDTDEDDSDTESALDFDIITGGGDEVKDHEISEALQTFFQQTAECFKASSHGHQWGCCSLTWAFLLPMSQDEAGTTRIDWNINGGYNFSFTSSYSKIVLDLHDFQGWAKAHSALVWLAFTHLFPPNYPESLFGQLSNLGISSFRDDIHSNQSLFDREDNTAVFSPYSNALRGLWSTESPASTYISALREFQMLLTQAITLQNGIAMRAFQTAGLKFAAVANLPRNIYIDGNQCYIAKPEAKQRFRTLSWYDSYWRIDDQVGLAIILYLGIFRPVEFSTHRPIDTTTTFHAGALYPYLFLNISHDNEAGWTFTQWSGPNINHALMHKTSPLRAEARVHRHFTKALLRRYLSDKALKISFDIPLNDNLRGDDPRNIELRRRRQLALSTAVHEMLGLRPLPSLGDNQTAFEEHGLQHARHLVRHVYGLYGSDEASIRSKVATLLEMKPFLYGATPGDANQNRRFSGDAVLVETTATVIYGSSKPAPMQPIPFNGYPLESVSISLAIIWAAIHEWNLGTFRMKRASTSSFQNVCQIFQQKLVAILSEEWRSWISFCQRVHTHANKAPAFAEAAPQPHVVPQTDLLPFKPDIQDTTRAQIPRLTRELSSSL
ncbi:hypothetical protein BKA70DRAFT_1430578 [Coprinopsis sp. MPI-PUGE-AT-0042]|nr:hypothetical protein BKA70DRAFT_1430578 [Coprinopsis sp. MPI-PUGE-AT-0042]